MEEVKGMEIDDTGEADIDSDHNWMWLDIKGVETRKVTGKSKPRWKWKMSEETDWTKYRVELEKEIATLKELNPEQRNRDIANTWGQWLSP